MPTLVILAWDYASLLALWALRWLPGMRMVAERRAFYLWIKWRDRW